MNTIVNKEGRLYRRFTINKRGYNQYELVEAPQLRYSKNWGTRFALTEEDGVIYDTHSLTFVGTEGDFKKICELPDYIYALNEDGRLYLISLDDQESIPIFYDVKFLAQLATDYILAVVEEFILIIDNSYVHNELSLINDIGLEEGEEIIDVVQNLIITPKRIYIVYEDYSIPCDHIKGLIIGMGVLDLRELAYNKVIIVSDDKGTLKLKYDNDKFYNGILDQMHQECPWIEMITIENNPHLLNADGLTVRLTLGGGLTSSKIPPEIFRTTRMKNANTKL